MKRCFDFILATILLVILFPISFILALLVKLTSPGPVLYWSDRIGKNNVLFKMPKFRTMRIDTPALPTHLMKEADKYLTPIGAFLRKSSLDEIPQLISIIRGDMSFVGPRPALFNQDDLVALRTQAGLHLLTPGLTGWAQINGRDSLSIPEKVKTEIEYLERKSFLFDIYICFRTFQKFFFENDVSH